MDKGKEEIPAAKVLIEEVKAARVQLEDKIPAAGVQIEEIQAEKAPIALESKEFQLVLEKLHAAIEKGDHSPSVEGIHPISVVIGGEPVLDPLAPNFNDDPPFAARGGGIVAAFDLKNQGSDVGIESCICEKCSCCDNCKHGNSASTRGCRCIIREANIPLECCRCAVCRCLPD